MIGWDFNWVLHKSEGGSIFVPGNTLTDLGKQRIIDLLYGEAVTNLTATPHIGAGNGDEDFAADQTDLQGASKFYQSATAVKETDSIEWTAVFAAGDASFTWQELGLFDDDAGVMVNRRLRFFGTKPSDSTWTIVATATVSG